MNARQLIFAANWKMNHGPAEARAFGEKFLPLTAPIEDRNLWFFPPAVSIGALSQAMGKRADVRIGAQNVPRGVEGRLPPGSWLFLW